MRRVVVVMSIVGSVILGSSIVFRTDTEAAPSRGAAPAPALQQVVFSLTKVQVQGDADSSSDALGNAKVGTTVFLFIGVNVSSAPANTSATFKFTVTRGGNVQFQQARVKSISGPGAYSDVMPYTLDKEGDYTFIGEVTIGGQTLRDQALITAKGETATPTPTPNPTPTPTIKGSVSFDDLEAQNLSGQSQTKFPRGAKGFFFVSWTLKHFRGSHKIKIYVFFERPLGKRWKVYYSFVWRQKAKNGGGEYTSDFHAPSHDPSLRIMVQLQVGKRWSTPKQRYVTIYVT